MKIEVDVLGVEQAVDFNTLASASFVVLEVFGERVRVPISEDQLVTMTSAAMANKVSAPSLTQDDEEVFEDTRERSSGQVFSPDLVSEEIPEREYSVMAGLTDQPGEPEVESSVAGILPDVFGDPEKEKQLRARRPRRTVSQDEAGNPVAHQVAGPVSALPKMSMYGLSDDDGFGQG